MESEPRDQVWGLQGINTELLVVNMAMGQVTKVETQVDITIMGAGIKMGDTTVAITMVVAIEADTTVEGELVLGQDDGLLDLLK
jgi:hypothetical protein